MTRNANKPVEEQLLGEDAEIFSLEPALSVGFDAADFSLADEQAATREAKKVLTGPEAMAFLGLPPRPLNYLKKGDHRRIHKKFKALFQEWEERVSNNRTISIDPDQAFWKRLKIRVWNKANLAQLHPEKGIKGKKTAGCPSLGIEPGEYAGDPMDGRAISTFLSETHNSERPREYFIQLEAIEVTEDMLTYA